HFIPFRLVLNLPSEVQLLLSKSVLQSKSVDETQVKMALWDLLNGCGCLDPAACGCYSTRGRILHIVGVCMLICFLLYVSYSWWYGIGLFKRGWF
uniref:Uncharacterized protein n=1 Tax=Anopheles minimus TaxID=112268 RepID=A0A182WPU6_9DIPT